MDAAEAGAKAQGFERRGKRPLQPPHSSAAAAPPPSSSHPGRARVKRRLFLCRRSAHAGAAGCSVRAAAERASHPNPPVVKTIFHAFSEHFGFPLLCSPCPPPLWRPSASLLPTLAPQSPPNPTNSGPRLCQGACAAGGRKHKGPAVHCAALPPSLCPLAILSKLKFPLPGGIFFLSRLPPLSLAVR